MDGAAIKFAIRSVDGRVQELTVDADTARIGSGSHCEVRLASEDAAVEQLLVRVHSGGLFGEARSRDCPTLLNGVPFVQGRLLPESVIRLGRVELSVSPSERGRAAANRAAQATSSRRLVAALGVIAVTLLLALALLQRQAPESGTALRPPPLWSEDLSTQCAQHDPESALALAERIRLQAEAARERAPFSPQDGVQAVQLFAQAAACYSAAEAQANAEQARSAMEALKKQLARSFHVHSVRLERALVTERHEQARTEAQILLSFGARRTDPYFSWLATLERQIELKFTGKKS